MRRGFLEKTAGKVAALSINSPGDAAQRAAAASADPKPAPAPSPAVDTHALQRSSLVRLCSHLEGCAHAGGCSPAAAARAATLTRAQTSHR